MGVDLCTVDDVINEGTIEGTALNDKIAWKIIDLSDDIRFESDDDTLTRANRDAKRACVFGILTWLEQKRLIASSRKAYQEREGQTMVSFEQRAGDPKDISQYAVHMSYSELFEKYMQRLVPYTPIGSKLPCRLTSLYGYYNSEFGDRF
jgi:hypothetical protein